MDSIDRQTLVTLATRREFPSVSLYLPLHPSDADKRQDMLRLKNLVTCAAEGLAEGGLRTPQATGLLDETISRLDDPPFWTDSARGLAVFAEPGLTRIYRVDTELPEQCVVGGRYYLRPLALALHADESFFALALDRGRTRLFAGDRSEMLEIHLDPSVTSYAETAGRDEHEESLQLSTIASPESAAGVGRAIGRFHGHGGENVDKDELLRFSARLERAVTAHIGPESTVPLVLLGVGYQLAAYRAVNTYHATSPRQVEGATDEMSEAEIQTAALEALRPHFTVAVENDVAELEGKRAELVARSAPDIVNAAATGRVKTLFFDDSTGPFGQFDRTRFSVSSVCESVPRYLRESKDPKSPDKECGWDLIDLAMAETVLHGGTIRAFSRDSSPVSGAAAILRY